MILNELIESFDINVKKVNKRNNRQQPPPLLYSIDIWPARNSKLKQHKTNQYTVKSEIKAAARIFFLRFLVRLVYEGVL